jgi:hypothetical protein
MCFFFTNVEVLSGQVLEKNENAKGRKPSIQEIKEDWFGLKGSKWNVIEM